MTKYIWSIGLVCLLWQIGWKKGHELTTSRFQIETYFLKAFHILSIFGNAMETLLQVNFTNLGIVIYWGLNACQMGVCMQNFPTNEVCLFRALDIVMHGLLQECHNEFTNRKSVLHNMRGNNRMQVCLSFIHINNNICLLYVCD